MSRAMIRVAHSLFSVRPGRALRARGLALRRCAARPPSAGRSSRPGSRRRRRRRRPGNRTRPRSSSASRRRRPRPTARASRSAARMTRPSRRNSRPLPRLLSTSRMPFLRSISSTDEHARDADLLERRPASPKAAGARRTVSSGRRRGAVAGAAHQDRWSRVALADFLGRKRCSVRDLPPGTVYAAAGRPARLRRCPARDIAWRQQEDDGCVRAGGQRAQPLPPRPAVERRQRHGGDDRSGRIRDASANALGASPARLTWCPLWPSTLAVVR